MAECRYRERFGKPVADVFTEKCLETNGDPQAICDSDVACDMFTTYDGESKTCFYTATASQIKDDRNFAGEGTTKYRDCSDVITAFLQDIAEGGEADESQKAVTEAMIDAIEDAGNVRVRAAVDEEKWEAAEKAAKKVSLCEVKQGEFRCDVDVYEPIFKNEGTVKCDEVIEVNGRQESVGLFSALRGLTEEQCLRKCDNDEACSGVAYWQTGMRANMDSTAQFYADMNDPTIMARKDTCELWVGDDRGEEGVCLEDKRKDTEVRVVIVDTSGLVREYDTKAYHKIHLEKALKVGQMEGSCKFVQNENASENGLEYKLEGCAMLVVKFFDSSGGEGQTVSERIMEDSVTNQSNRWRYVGDGECRTKSGGFELLREYLSSAKFDVVSEGVNYRVGNLLTVAGGNNDARIAINAVTPTGGIREIEIIDEGSEYAGGEVYVLSGGSGEGARVEMTEMSMALCQKKCSQNELCKAMAFDENENGGTTCRLYQGKHAYTQVHAGGKNFSPDDFTPEAPGKCDDGTEFLAKDDIGRSIVTMAKGEEQKCLQRCESIPGCRSVNMKTEGDALICKTLGTCNVENATRNSTPWRFANLKVGKGVPVHYPHVQAIDKRTCRKGLSRQQCSSTRDWLRFYKKMVPDCNSGELKICSVDDKKACAAKTNEVDCRKSGACAWDGSSCRHDPEKCPIPGESPIVTSTASNACRASLQKYMRGRFIGVDGGERGRICPPNGTSIPISTEEACRKMCTDRPECAYYTFFPGKGGGVGACSIHREEECRTMISSNFDRDGAVSNEKVYDLSVDEAIVASAQEQCWAKDVKTDIASSLLITPEFKGDDYVKDSSRCVLLGERETCVSVVTKRDEKECPLPDLPCYAGYEDGCVAAEAGSCPSITIPRDHRTEILRSVSKGKVDCIKATSRTECAVMDGDIANAFSLVDPTEGIGIETLFLSEENGVPINLASKVSDAERSRALPKRYGHQIMDISDNAKVEGKAVECTLSLDSNTYLMMLSGSEGIDSSKGIVEALVKAEGSRNISMRSPGERCSSHLDCAPTATDESICELATTEEDCTAPTCTWDGAFCKAQHGTCDLTGEHSCLGRCLADKADPYKTRQENCPTTNLRDSCEAKLERVAKAIRPKRSVRGYSRRRRQRPKRQPQGGSCRRNADCQQGNCVEGFCGGLTEKRALGEVCDSEQPCADGLRCGESGPCAGRCQNSSGSCAAGFVSLTSSDFEGGLDVDMFGCIPRTSSAAEAAEKCAQSLPIDPAIPGVKRCNAFMRFEDRHPGELSGKTCFYQNVGDQVNAALVEEWETLRGNQSRGQGASGDLYIRNVTQPLTGKSSKTSAKSHVRPMTMGPSTPILIAPGCDSERNELAAILQSLDDPAGSTEAVNVEDALQQNVSLPESHDLNPCNEEGRCCPSKDYIRKGNICFGKEGRVNGTRCRLGEISLPNSEQKRFDLLLSIVKGESGCSVEGGKLKVMVNSDLHAKAFQSVPSFSNMEELRQRGGFMRTTDNRFDILEFRPGFEKLSKGAQIEMMENVISTVMPECPSISDRIAMAKIRIGDTTVAEGKGKINPLMITAMVVVGIALGIARAKKKVSTEVLGGYGALCAIALLLSM